MTSISTASDRAVPGVTVIYDGECPFCSSYVQLLRLREAVGEVTLLDAREKSREVMIAQSMGFDLNEGMIVRIGDQYFRGPDAIQRLALMSTKSGLFNRIAAATFRSPRRSRMIYPILKCGRHLTLRLLGRRFIEYAN